MSRASHGLGVLLTLWLSASTGGSSTSPCSALYCYESPRTARATDEQERFVASRLHGRGPEYAALASKLVQRCLQVLQDRGDGGAGLDGTDPFRWDGPDPFERAWPYAWTAVQHLVAAVESAPADASVWDSALATLLELNAVDQELNLVQDHKLLKYARGAVELHARRGDAAGLRLARTRVKQVLEARPHLASALERNPSRRDGPAFLVEERLMHEQARRAAVEWSKLGVIHYADSIEDVAFTIPGDSDSDSNVASPSPPSSSSSSSATASASAAPPAAAGDVLPPAASHLLGSLTADRGLSLGGMDTYEVWPTRVSTIHLPTAMPDRVNASFMVALNDAAEQVYRRHREMAEADAADRGEPKPGATELNNGFFEAQQGGGFIPGTGQDPEQPSLFAGSREYAELQEIAYDMCVEHAMRSGKWRYTAQSAEPSTREAAHAWFARQTKLEIWAAVYTNGTFHMPHQHEAAICSGVFYSRAEPGSSPIVFSDPRGGSTFAIAAQNVALERVKTPKGRRAQAAEPVAPFVHQYAAFPTAGDMVLFPSYLIHQVLPNPSAEREASRIAFAFNLNSDFDCWMRSNV